MILCSQCGSNVDEGRRFCAECGAQVGIAFESKPTESASVSQKASGGLAVRRSDGARASVAQPASSDPGATAINPPATQASAGLPRARNTLRTIAFTALATVLLLGAGGGIALTYLGSKNGGDNHKASGANENQNIMLVAKQESAQPTKKQALQATAANAPSISQEVINTLNGWAAATSRHDLNAHMSFYAQVLHTYYGRKNVSASFVSSNRAPAFARYPELNVQLSNISVTPDPSGARATAVFDKSYVFRGDKELSGSVRQMAWLEKTGSQWLITGEKDLQVYYSNR